MALGTAWGCRRIAGSGGGGGGDMGVQAHPLDLGGPREMPKFEMNTHLDLGGPREMPKFEMNTHLDQSWLHPGLPVCCSGPCMYHYLLVV